MTHLGDGRLVAVLRRRGKFNPEKDWGKESYPGACQVTAHGKVKDGETSICALIREVREELGDEFARFVVEKGMKLIPGERSGLREVDVDGPMKLISHTNHEDHLILNWGIYANRSLLNCIRLHPETGNIEFIAKEDLRFVGLLQPYHKEKGINSLSSITMFESEIDVTLRAFDLFS